MPMTGIEAPPQAADQAVLEQRLGQLESRLAELEARQPEDRVSMVVFSGDLDKVLAAFVVATGAAASRVRSRPSAWRKARVACLRAITAPPRG